LMAGIFSLFPLRLFTFLWKSDRHLPSLLSIDFKNASCVYFLDAGSCFDSFFSFSVQCKLNFLVLYTFLTFDFNRLIFFLQYSGSQFCNCFVWYKTLFTLVYYIFEIIPYLLHAAARCMPILQIYRGASFVSLRRIPGLPFLPGVQCMCPPIPLPRSPQDDH
jgi:hypothetical protein